MTGPIRRTVAIAVPAGAQSLDVSGPLDVFLEAARQSDGSAGYDVRLLSMGGGTVVRAGGMSIVADQSFHEAVEAIDTLLIAGTPEYSCAFAMQDFTAWLQARAPGMRRYGSVCTGAFFLGAAGLLDGRKATTHWQHAAELSGCCPAATILPDAIYVRDGSLYTSAGVTAGIDLALRLVEDDQGRELAMKVARRLVVFLRRPGGQSQFSAHLAAQLGAEGRIQTVQHWILEDVTADLSLPTMAAHAAMSVRNFARLFQKETGTTPADFVELARVEAARRLLEDTSRSLQSVASRSGFTNADLMRRAFLRRIGTGPAEYRERFRF